MRLPRVRPWATPIMVGLALLLTGCGNDYPSDTFYRYRVNGGPIIANGVTLTPVEVLYWPRVRKDRCQGGGTVVAFSVGLPPGRKVDVYLNRVRTTDYLSIVQPSRDPVTSDSLYTGPQTLGDARRKAAPPYTESYVTVDGESRNRIAPDFFRYDRFDEAKPFDVGIEKVAFEGEDETWSYHFKGLTVHSREAVSMVPNLPCGRAYDNAARGDDADKPWPTNPPG